MKSKFGKIKTSAKIFLAGVFAGSALYAISYLLLPSIGELEDMRFGVKLAHPERGRSGSNPTGNLVIRKVGP